MNSTFCSLFWRHMAPDTAGNVKPCCVSYTTVNKEDGTPYNYGYDNINDIFNSKHYQEMRELSKQGKPVPGCDECYATEKFGGVSNRIFYNSISDVDVDNPKLDYLDLRLGNKCNLACASCNPTASSMLAKELGVEQQINDWFTTDTFNQNINSQLENIKIYYLTGGEPTIIKQNEELLSSLVEAGKTDIHISINTNLASYNSRFYELLTKFESVWINASIDGIGPLQEYIRYPSKWQVIDRNLQRVLEFGMQVVATPVIQLSNLNKCVELFDYFESFNRQAGKQVIKIFPIDLVNPTQLDLIHLPMDFKIMCWERIEDWLNNSNQYNPELIDRLSSIKNRCYTESDTDINEYLSYTNSFNVRRGTSLEVANPELAEILNR